MTIIDRIILWILTSLGINTEADAAEPTINWLVPEGTSRKNTSNYRSGWGLVSSYKHHVSTNSPSLLHFAMANVAILPEACAEIGEFTVRYAYYNRCFGVFVSPKGGSFWEGVFYQVVAGNDRASCEDVVHAALLHCPRVMQYMQLLKELGHSHVQGISIGQEGSACTFYAGHDDKIVGPEVVLHKGSDEVSYSAWAIRFVPVIGPWLYIADFHGDYRHEIRDFFAEIRSDAA